MKLINFLKIIIFLCLVLSIGCPLPGEFPQRIVPTGQPEPEQTMPLNVTPIPIDNVTQEPTAITTPAGNPEPTSYYDPTPEATPVPDSTSIPTPDSTPEATPVPIPVQTPDLIQTPNPTEIPVDSSIENPKASILEYPNRILVTWRPVETADLYVLYRYTKKNQYSLDVIMETTENYFYDDDSSSFDPPLCNVPYFYKITWKLGDFESSLPGWFVPGLCSDGIDPFEPDNDDYGNLLETPSSVFDPLTPSFIYTVSDGSGGCLGDVDWYTYKGPPQMVAVEITLLSGFDSQFLKKDDCNLYFTFFYNGLPGQPQKVYADVMSFYFYESNFTTSVNEVELYYKVYTEAPSDENIIERYRIHVSHSY